MFYVGSLFAGSRVAFRECRFAVPSIPTTQDETIISTRERLHTEEDVFFLFFGAIGELDSRPPSFPVEEHTYKVRRLLPLRSTLGEEEQ